MSLRPKIRWPKVVTNLVLLKTIVMDIIVTAIVAGGLAWLGWYNYNVAHKANTLASKVSANALSSYKECQDLNRVKSSILSFVELSFQPREGEPVTPGEQQYVDSLIERANQDFASSPCQLSSKGANANG